jgi:hypothetical protein
MIKIGNSLIALSVLGAMLVGIPTASDARGRGTVVQKHRYYPTYRSGDVLNPDASIDGMDHQLTRTLTFAHFCAGTHTGCVGTALTNRPHIAARLRPAGRGGAGGWRDLPGCPRGGAAGLSQRPAGGLLTGY